jgi:hypothetical protein
MTVNKVFDRVFFCDETTYVISAYHHYRCEFELRSGEFIPYNIMLLSLWVTFGRSVVFTGYSGFLHQIIVESGVKHHKLKPSQIIARNICINVRFFNINFISLSTIFHITFK